MLGISMRIYLVSDGSYMLYLLGTSNEIITLYTIREVGSCKY
jgi:hypothetical protein